MHAFINLYKYYTELWKLNQF